MDALRVVDPTWGASQVHWMLFFRHLADDSSIGNSYPGVRQSIGLYCLHG